MPTYAYRCNTCDHRFEQFQKFSEDPLTECPACQEKIQRVIQPIGVVFKGSGWYINDSRKAAPNENGATATASKSETSNGSTSAESGPVSETAKSAKTEPAKSGEASSKKDAAPAAAKRDAQPAAR